MSVFSGTVIQKAPVGSLKFSVMSTPDKGYLRCDGSAISRTTYADLFAYLGTRFGAGDGSTTFNLPNFGNYCRFLITPSLSSTIPVIGNGKPVMFVQKPKDTTDIKRRCFFQRNNDGQPSVQVGGYDNTTLPYQTGDTPADYGYAFGLDKVASMSGIVAQPTLSNALHIFIKYSKED